MSLANHLLHGPVDLNLALEPRPEKTLVFTSIAHARPVPPSAYTDIGRGFRLRPLGSPDPSKYKLGRRAGVSTGYLRMPQRPSVLAERHAPIFTSLCPGDPLDRLQALAERWSH